MTQGAARRRELTYLFEFVDVDTKLMSQLSFGLGEGPEFYFMGDR